MVRKPRANRFLKIPSSSWSKTGGTVNPAGHVPVECTMLDGIPLQEYDAHRGSCPAERKAMVMTRRIIRRSLPTILLSISALIVSACATLQVRDPLQVTVAGIDSLPGEDLEFRMMVKLRVQNPNDAPVDYDGVSLKLDVLDKTFATGVSDERGSVPRFGESVINVPVTVSTLRTMFNALGMIGGGPIDKVRYNLEGKLSGPVFGSTKFTSQGELALPAAMSP